MYRCRQRRLSASDISRALFEVSTTSGICLALNVPISGTVTWKSESSSSRKASNSASALSISSISSTTGFSDVIALSSGRGSTKRSEKKTSSSLAIRSTASARPFAPDQHFADLVLQDLRIEQLLGVLPFVERLALVEPLVALQADQVRGRATAPAPWPRSVLPTPAGPSTRIGFLQRGRQIDHGRDSAAGDVIVAWRIARLRLRSMKTFILLGAADTRNGCRAIPVKYHEPPALLNRSVVLKCAALRAPARRARNARARARSRRSAGSVRPRSVPPAPVRRRRIASRRAR